MKINKKLFFKIHSWVGINLSILFFIVCFSGTIATISTELDWIFNKSIRVKPQKHRASKNLIVQNLKELYPEGRITYWPEAAAPYAAQTIYLIINKQRYYVFANQYTGEIQGKKKLTIQRFFRDLHYYLFIPYRIGHYIVLSFAFFLLISILTPLFFYKKWYKKFLEFKKSKNSLLTFRSLHRIVGLWSLLFGLMITITGLWYFAERSNIANIKKEANPRKPKIEGISNKEADRIDSYTIDYDKVVSQVTNLIPDFVVKDIFVPNKTNQTIYINGHDGTPIVRHRANRIYLNPTTYEPVEVLRAEDGPWKRIVNDLADPIHFGYWGGLLTKLIWFFFGLALSSLILTGLWISLKRQFKSKKIITKPIYQQDFFVINTIIVLIILYYMYAKLLRSYSASPQMLVTISIGWFLFYLFGWYIFDFLLRKKPK